MIANIALRDLDLLLKVKKIKTLYISNGKSWRRNVWETFVDVVISIRIMSLRKCSMVLTFLFEGQNLKMLISMKLWASAKILRMTFQDFDIFQRMVELRKLYLMTLTYIFKVNSLKCLYIGNIES